MSALHQQRIIRLRIQRVLTPSSLLSAPYKLVNNVYEPQHKQQTPYE